MDAGRNNMQMRQSDGTPAVEALGISKRFRSAEGDTVYALNDVSVSVSAGKFTTLLGPSGCGKTTLLRTIGGFEEPDEGSIIIDGAEMTHNPPFARPVNTVFQQYALFPHLTIAGNVAYGLEVAGVKKSEIRQRVSEALNLVRLDGYGDRRVNQLSGGQQQRVALARSLVLKPKVLLLDEPLAALDRKLRKEMQIELKTLQNEIGIAFLCVTHDQEEALSMSDTVVVMNAGRIEQIGSPRDIYDRPASRFVARFVGEASVVTCRAGAVQGGGRSLLLEDGQSLVTAQAAVPDGELSAIIRPERLSIAKVGTDLPTIKGRVSSSIYLGDKVRLEVRLDDKSAMVALIDGLSEPPAKGTEVELAYDPTHVRVVSS
jgi:spermidine/putrescine transport system ATP-binding protein